jgi:hypothetical protein
VQQVERGFKRLYGCKAVSVERVGGGSYEAQGCGHKVAYRCVGEHCEEDERVTPIGDVSPEGGRPATVTVMVLDMRLQGAVGATLTINASPQESADVSLSLMTRGSVCALEVMLDGQRVALPVDANDPTRVTMSRGFVRDMGVAQHMALRYCDRRWTLDQNQLEQLHAFVARYEEELAWNDEPSNSPSAGHKPPFGGWRAWRGLGQRPNAQTGAAALPPPLLFQKLSPSVLRVEATFADGGSQGSAVAVSPSLVATNCHVIEGASKIAVKQSKVSYSAVLAQSDPATDRCVLEVTPATLTPIAGVRAYSELTVGEPLYTLGNPSGLDLSLADGMLSGLRTEDGQRYVQTTAPISPGSSGGGLFDAQGNLVGITTLVLIGKDNHNQALNFAIAAEGFWQP